MQEIKKKYSTKQVLKLIHNPMEGGDFRSTCMDRQQPSIPIHTKYTEINKNTDYNGVKDPHKVYINIMTHYLELRKD